MIGLMGITIVSVLSGIINLPDQVPIDSMHAIYEGVVKKMLSFPPFTDGKTMTIMAILVNRIKFPHFFHRRQRNFYCINKWKASEFKVFLLYSVPVLNGIIPDKFFALIMILSIFVRSYTSRNMMSGTFIASKLIDTFCDLFQDFYGIVNCSSNLHSLRHLAEQIRFYGSLANTSAFAFEDFIGYLKSSSHGTKDASFQVLQEYVAEKSILVYTNQLESNGKYSNITGHRFRSASDEIIPNGQITIETRSANNVILFTMKKDWPGYSSGLTLRICHRIKKRNIIFSSKTKSKSKDSNVTTASSVISFNRAGVKSFGEIQYFVLPFDPESHDQILAVVKTFRCQRNRSLFHGKRVLLESLHPNFKILFDEGILERHFQHIHERGKEEILIVPFNDFHYHSVVVSDSKSVSYVTELDCEFESN